MTWILYDHGQNKRSSNERLLQQLNTYHAARHKIRLDPDDLYDWSLHLTLDLEKPNEFRTPVIHLESALT